MIRWRTERILSLFRRIFEVSLQKFIGIAIIAYFSGWTYIHYYFSYFNVNHSSLSFDNYTVFLYSFFVSMKLPYVLMSGQSPAATSITICFLIMLLILGIDIRGRTLSVLAPFLRILTVALGVVWVFVCSRETGRIDAMQVALNYQKRPITLVLTKDFHDALERRFNQRRAASFIDKLYQAERCNGLALIWRSSDETLILQYEATDRQNPGDPLVSHRIPNDFIALIGTRMKTANEEEFSECQDVN